MQVLSSENSEKKLPMASVTKVMSLLLWAEQLEAGTLTLEETVRATSAVQGTDGSVIWLEPGDELTAAQLLEAVILGGLCLGGMLAFRLPFAVLISTVVGVTALIPVFGALIGIGLGAFFILLVAPIKALWFVIFMIALQQIEGNLIYPKVMGRSVGLPGFWVLIAVSIGSAFGILGMIISVPLCSVAYSLIGQTVEERLKRASSQKDAST
jgi:predicted PurR-regulated permease PerM